MIRPSANSVESDPLAPKRVTALSWLLPLALMLVAAGVELSFVLPLAKKAVVEASLSL